MSFFLSLSESEKPLEKLKISVKQEGNTRQPAVPSEQKALASLGVKSSAGPQEPGRRELCHLLGFLEMKIQGGEAGGTDSSQKAMSGRQVAVNRS